MEWLSALTYGPAFVFSVFSALFTYLLGLVRFLAIPFLYVGHGLLHLAFLPVRVLARFEVFLFFVAGAVLTGTTIGLLVYWTGASLSHVLRISEDSSPPPDDVEPEEPPFDYLAEWKAMGDRQLLSTAIVEEEESSQDST
ncbi:hypothetical protein N7510_006262 [Penicillium lagena]|uniref:uncharacterized protein n=1 Tax=Penicillium lagena TaxID=94218 RepID=UPI002541716C|nr:uncharacterized protein N7510_006262 [Penicillium lagena]KAJ5613068.1 hypothetical protein N7510_006262 [Penicillium lagena]